MFFSVDYIKVLLLLNSVKIIFIRSSKTGGEMFSLRWQNDSKLKEGSRVSFHNFTSDSHLFMLGPVKFWS